MYALRQLALQGFGVAFTTTLILVPLCIMIARRFGIVDVPGGRKQHSQSTALLGGVAVFFGSVAGAVAMITSDVEIKGFTWEAEQLHRVIVGCSIIFLVGLLDDFFKDRMPFQPKLAGQILGVLYIAWPLMTTLFEAGGPIGQWLYLIFFISWFLMIINSFNFSDNMNGLMSGLSVVSFIAAIFYLADDNSIRSMLLSVSLVGALLGFLPFNFPRAKIFLGDAGSMFVGFTMAWVMLNLSKRFGNESLGTDLGLNTLIPAVLIMGVPLFDAAFVVVMRMKEGRKVYLGDDQHLSHRLVRGGFSNAEAVFILWGIGVFLAGVGTFVVPWAEPVYRYLLFMAGLLVMIVFATWVMALEKAQLDGGRRESS